MRKLLLICLMATIGQANALVINDFTGAYDIGNWTQSLDGGIIDTTRAPDRVVAISNNSGSETFASTDLTIASAGDGYVTFDWSYSTRDVFAFWDPFGYLLNGAFTQLSLDRMFTPQSGTAFFAVNAGDVFGFSQQSLDSLYGSAATVISGFSAPGAAVSEPGLMILLLTGLISIGLSRKLLG